jgi:hypothetical protein
LQQWRRRSRLALKDLTGQDQVLYLKRFRMPPLREQVSRMLHGVWWHGTAWIEWNNIRRLQAIGVPTMRPIAFAEKLMVFWELGSLLCTQQVPGGSLERWLPKQWQEAVRKFGPAWRKQVVMQLAKLVRRMHAANLCHRDLYTSHLFVKLDPNGTVCFHVIDLQRMFRLRVRRRRWWAKDLAALAGSAPAGLISRTDRLRFLLAYLGPNIPRAEAKRWWRSLQKKAERMMQHHELRMQRLAAGNNR